MPRISPRQWGLARHLDTQLFRLLPVCRDIPTAANELRWLGKHAKSNIPSRAVEKRRLDSYVTRRSRNEPLQYILGSEWFGELEIKCRPGVLIPRQETASSVSYLVRLLSQRKHLVSLPGRLRVLDACTGTGCIPLLFHHDFYASSNNHDTPTDFVGIDISRHALKLARENLAARLRDVSQSCSSSVEALRNMTFHRADILEGDPTDQYTALSPIETAIHKSEPSSVGQTFDILISNPPYISASEYKTTTSRSVRRYEPKLALVPPTLGQEYQPSQPPCNDGDIFYPRLLQVAKYIGAKIVLLEVSDMEQADRVACLAVQQSIWSNVEIWRDDPSSPEKGVVKVCDKRVTVRGAGHGRSVFAYRDNATEWVEAD